MVNRIFGSLLLAAVLSTFSPAAQAGKAEEMFVTEAAFSSASDSFFAGPQWLRYALSSRVPLRSAQNVYSSSTTYQAQYVGTLLEPYQTSDTFISVLPHYGAASSSASSAPLPSAPDATKIWANVGSDWATAGNWTGGAPANDTTTDVASFGADGAGAVNPNVASARSVAGITFNAGAFAYTISGATLTIGATGISDSATNTETFSNSLAISAGQTWTSNTGANLVVDGTINLNANSATSRALTVTGAGNTTFNNTVLNSFAGSTGNLTKTGTGTLTLNGNNTYSGTTNVSGGGTLLVNGNQSSATGAVSVTNAGTVLGGTGMIGGAVTVTTGRITGGTLGTVGTLTLNNNLTISGTGGYAVDLLGAGSDKLAIGGTLDLSGASDVLAFSGTADGTSTYTLATYSSLLGTFNTVTGLPANYQLVYGTNELDLVPVPEMSTWISGALALGFIGFTQRRKLRGLIAGRA